MRIDTINSKPKFHKDKEGKYTEGFLDKEKFNGVVFLLKEPNSRGEPANDFWFKKVIHNEDNFISKLTKIEDKIAATKYPNYFKKCLRQIGLNDEELKYCVYMNIYPYSGEEQASRNYQKFLMNFDEKSERWKVIENLRPEVIFTCKDIYNRIKTVLNISVSDEKNGIKYKDKTLSYFETKIGNTITRIYAIYHPTAPKSIM